MYRKSLIAFLLSYLLVCAGSLSAQEFQLVPISPLDQPAQYRPAGSPRSQLSLPTEAATEVQSETSSGQATVTGLSEFEEYISGRIALTISTNIRQFGYDLFRYFPSTSINVEKMPSGPDYMKPQLPSAPADLGEIAPREKKKRLPSTFAPVVNVPVGPDYVVGPGDEIKVTIWGKVEGQWNVVVDRDGSIGLPKVGILGVTGLSFKELKDLLFKELSKYYTGFEMNVSMGALRSIRVYVVGNAQRPGSYTVSSLSTLVSALFETGGPSKTGTLRDIQLKRSGKTIVRFDMYDFLLRGDKSHDVRLMPEDVIFIPPVGPVAAIAGSVNTPAIYELNGDTTISQLIETAGGLNAVAFKGRVQVERVIDKSRQTVFESNLDEVRDKNIRVHSGDLVKIFQVVQDRKLVRLTGAIQREGEYGVSSGMTVKDLISMAGGLKYYAYRKDAELTRVHVTDKGPRTEKIIIALEEALAGNPDENIAIKENDYLFVRTIPEWRLHQIVSITGEVKFPGVYTIRKGERLSSLIKRVGGYTDNAYLKGTVFTREKVRALQQERVDEMVDRLEKEFLSIDAAQAATAISPEAAKMMGLEADQKKRFVEKLRTVKAKGRLTIQSYMPDKLKGTPYDIALENGDSIYIPINPNTVQTIGSVYNQTAFVYEKGKNVKYYINLAGGFTGNAAEDDIYVFKANGSAIRASGGLLGLSWNSEYSRWEVGGQVEPGDTIVVPEKLAKIAWMRNIKDITQILFRIAVTAGVVIAAFP